MSHRNRSRFGRAVRRGAPPSRHVRKHLRFESLEARRVLAAEIEPNDTLAEATTFSSGDNALTGSIAHAGDVDYFKVNLSRGEQFTVDYGNAGLFNLAVTAGIEILDGDGAVVSRRYLSEPAQFVAPATATYYVRTTSISDIGQFIGSYGLTISSPFVTIVAEIEPNDSAGAANAIVNFNYFGGELATTADHDFFTFTIQPSSGSQTLSLGFGNRPAKNPAVVLRDAASAVIATDDQGRGLNVLLNPGTYTIDISPDRAGGPISGPYAATIILHATAATVLAPNTLATAPVVNPGTTTAFASGRLDSLSDVHFYSFTTAEFETVSAVISRFQYNRLLRLYDEFGHVLGYNTNGSVFTSSFTASSAPAKYYLSVQALNETALGSYELAVNYSGSFSKQRDPALFFLDFTAQTSHLGYTWTGPFSTPSAIPFVQGMFGARYEAFDVDVTQTLPNAATDYVGQGYGNFGSFGAGGLGGGSSGGRRPDGDSITDASGTMSLTSLNSGRTETLNHEFGHAIGLPHIREPRNVLSYEQDQRSTFPYGNGYSFIGGDDTYYPSTFQQNPRDYLDFVLQPGRQIVEAEPNNTPAAALGLDRFLDEMRWDTTLGATIPTGVGTGAEFVEKLDFNGDSNVDLLTAHINSDQFKLYLGNGAGGFALSSTVATPRNLVSTYDPFGIGDVNGDGKDDVIALSGLVGDTVNEVNVYLGSAGGTLGTPSAIALSVPQPRTVRLANLNNDNFDDLIVAHATNQVSVLLGNGNGTFQPATVLTTGGSNTNNYAMSVADIDNDTFQDVVVASSASSRFVVLRGKGDGTFHASVPYDATASAFPRALALLDVTQDGKLDVVVGNSSTRTILVYANLGNGTFPASPTLSYTHTNGFRHLAVGDLNNDGRQDLIASSFSTPLALLARADGTLTEPIRLPTSSGATSAVILDANEDGSNEVIAAHSADGALFTYVGQPNDPRNDRAVVSGRISSAGDADYYSFTATAGQTFAFDIDSAEFQNSLDAELTISNAIDLLVATSDDALDRDSGFDSVDPYITHTFAAAGTYKVRVGSRRETVGDYRLKITPQAAMDTEGPRVIGALPAGATNTGTRQIVLLLNDQLDPASLTSANIVVLASNGGVRSGTASFDPLDSTLVWTADAALPTGNYTVTLRSGAGGIRDLRGNLLDGESGGTLVFPAISGNGTAGGDFTHSFTISSADSTVAVINGSSYRRHPYNRGLFTLDFDSPLSLTSTAAAQLTLRGAGADNTFGTADDRTLPLDPLQDKLAPNRLWLYTRGVPDPDRYRIEGTVLDAAGFTVNLSHEVLAGVDVPKAALFQNEAMTLPGVTGSFVNSRMNTFVAHDDWRTSPAVTISGTRVDPQIHFGFNEMGSRAAVGVTGPVGTTDSDWNDFGVQWDGYVNIATAGTRLFTRSNDGSRLWIDINHDGVFGSSGDEFIDNRWGQTLLNVPFTGPLSAALPAGVYKIRLQYENTGFGNDIFLEMITPDVPQITRGIGHGPSVIDTSLQPGSNISAMATGSFAVTFSAGVDLATLTPANFKLRRSIDATFYNADDTFVADADGAIAWNAATHTATFTAAQPLAPGYYLVELNGDEGGIANALGMELDGEFLDSYIAGTTNIWTWQESPSGDGLPGGDYIASFSVSNTPTITGITSDTGTSATDRITNDKTLLFHGRTGAGLTVHFLREGTGEVGTTVADAAGNWTFDYSQTTLPEGTQSFRAAVFVGAELVWLPSDYFQMTIDTTIAPTTIAGISIDSGVSNTDLITNDREVTITGTAEPNAAVTISRSGVGTLITIAANAGGSWTFGYGLSLPDGNYTFTASAADLAGNVAVSNPLTVTIDGTSPAAPTIALLNDTGVAGDRVTRDLDVRLGGTGAAGHLVTVRSGAVALATATVTAGGQWEAVVRSWNPAQIDYFAVQSDVAGNSSVASPVIGVRTDLLPPLAMYSTTYEPFDTVATAFNIGGNFGDSTAHPAAFILNVGAELNSGTDIDFFKLGAMQAGDRLVLTSNGAGAHRGTLGASVVDLFLSGSASPIPVFPPLVGPGNDGLGAYTIVTPGEYYVAVRSPAQQTGTYQFSAWLENDAALPASGGNVQTESESNNTQASATDISSNWRAVTTLAHATTTLASSDTDYFSFPATAGDLLHIRTDAPSAIFGELSLFSANGTTEIAYDNRNFDVGPIKVPTSGTYYVRLRSLSGSTPYSLNVFLSSTTSPPGPPAPTFAGPDTGASTSDRITAFGNLNFTVNTLERAEFIVDGINVGQGTSGSGGLWSYTTATLADGPHSVQWRALDDAGNFSVTSAAVTVTVDRSAPAAPAITSFTNDTGASPSDGITNDGRLTLFGTAEPNASVSIRHNGVAVATVTANASGDWTLDRTAVLETNGALAFTAIATDLAGNVSATSAALNVTIDTLIATPAISAIAGDTGTSGTDFITNDPTLTLSGTADASTSVTVTRVGIGVIGSVTASAGGTWTFNYTGTTLPDGLHNFTVTSTDAAGNVATSAQRQVTVDTQIGQPVITSFTNDSGISTTDGITNNGRLTLFGTAEPNATVNVRRNGVSVASVTANAGGNWTLDRTTILEPDGALAFTATAADAAGNTSALSGALNVLIDTVAPATPTINLLNPTGASGSRTNQYNVRFGGAGTPGNRITVRDFFGVGFPFTNFGSTVVDGAGQWELTAQVIEERDVRYFAEESDTAGNVASSAQLWVEVDTTPPRALFLNISTVIDSPATAFNIGGNFGPYVSGPNTYMSVVGGSLTATTDIDYYKLGVLQAGDSLSLSVGAGGAHRGTLASSNIELYLAGSATPIMTVAATGPGADGLIARHPIAAMGEYYALVKSNAQQLGTYELSTFLEFAEIAPLTGGSVLVEAEANNSQATATDISSSWKSAQYLAMVSTNIDNTSPEYHRFHATAGDLVTIRTDFTTGAFTVPSASFFGTTGANELAIDPRNLDVYAYRIPATGDYYFRVSKSGLDTLGYQVRVFLATSTPPAPPAAPPYISDLGLSSTDNITRGTLQFTVSTGDAVQYFVDGAPTSTINPYLVSLPDGPHTVRWQPIDGFGNLGFMSDPVTITIDNAPPDRPVITHIADDTGISSTDRITSDRRIILHGTAEPNSQVSVLRNFSSTIGTVFADAAGNWLLDLTASQEFSNSVDYNASALDIAGNFSQPSTTFTVTFDTTPPTAFPGLIDLLTSSDTFNADGCGTFNTDNYTSDSTPTFGGTTLASHYVEVFDGAALLGMVQASAGGTWTFTAPTMADGAHSMTWRVLDVAGNASSTSPPLVVTIDTGAPSLALIANFGGFEDVAAAIPLAFTDAVALSSQLCFQPTFGTPALINVAGITVVQNGFNWTWNVPPTANQSGSTSVQVRPYDRAGNAGAAQNFTLTFAPVNDAPTAIGLVGSTVFENDAGATIGTVSVIDIDAGDTHDWTVDDTRFEIAGTTLKLKSSTALDFEVSPTVTVQITATDFGGLFLAQPFVINVTNRNEAPTAIQLSNSSVAENAAGAMVGTLSVTDPDTGGSHSYTVDDLRFEIVAGTTLKLKATESLDREATPTINLSVTVEDQGLLSTTQQFTITVANVNEAPTNITLSATSVAENLSDAAIAIVTVTDADGAAPFNLTVDDARLEIVGGVLRVRAGQAFNFEAASSVAINITATDAGGLPFSKPFTINVTNVNEAPTAINLAGGTVLENTAGAMVGTASTVDPDAVGSHTYTVSDGRFEMDGNELWLKSGVSLDFELTPTIELTITSTDQGDLPVARAFTIVVTNRNEAPTLITLSGNTAGENVASATLGTVAVFDPEGNNAHTFLVSDNRFRIVGNQLQLNGVALDYESAATFEITITATDGGGLSLPQVFTIIVTNANEAPSAISLSGNSVAENAAGAIIGDVSAIDPDAGASPGVTVDDARFEILAGQLKLKSTSTIDYEAEQQIVVTLTATDTGGLNKQQQFTIIVTNANEAPTAIFPSGDTIVENDVAGVVTAVALTVVDPDFSDSHNLSVADNRFEIVDGYLKLAAGVALDFEAVSLVVVSIRATDLGGLFVDQSFAITVINENEQPSAVLLSANTIDENDAGASAGTIVVLDPDAGDRHTLTVTDARFEVVDGHLKLLGGVALDYETTPMVSVTVIATDEGGQSRSQGFSIGVANVNEGPTNISVSALAVNENAIAHAVGAVTVTDPDAGDTFTYQLSDARFEITLGQLALKSGQALDFESAASVALTITATDAGGLSVARAFNIQVINRNEAPISIALAGIVVPENAAGAVAGTLSAVDPDTGDSVSFSTADPRFEISGTTLRLRALQSLDFESGATATVNVTATDGGGLTRTQAIVVEVGNRPEAPTGITLDRTHVFEGITGAWVAGVTVADPEGLSGLTLFVDDVRFEIRDGHLYVRAGQSISLPPGATIPIQITAQDLAAAAQISGSFTLTVDDGPANWTHAGQWKPNPYDVNADGLVTPLDALLIIIQLNAVGPGAIAPQPGGTRAPLFYDVSADNFVSPLDALLVVNYLNAGGQSEGEADHEDDVTALVDAVFGDEDWSLWQAAAWDALVDWRRLGGDKR